MFAPNIGKEYIEPAEHSVCKSDCQDFIRDKFGLISQREMARRLGLGKTTVNRWAEEIGCKFVKNSVDDAFFDSWSEESAYVFGFIISDGNVCWNPRKSYWTLTITASEKDVSHLEKLRSLLDSTKPLLYSLETKSYRLMATNKRLCKKLMHLGVLPRKSLTVRFPKIPKAFLKDFLRGVIDGDGNVRYVKRKRSPYFEITIASGSKEFCEGLIAAIKRNYGIPANVRRAHGHTYVVQYCCSRGEKLAEIIYSNATVFLERKYVAFDEAKKKRCKHG
ncbi:LAGLIDADG-like domain protein [Candidatus Norongarragalina meridionalis]|nr:LAGLIDADG-like domain protein [Candidatus Norongarragalina meridionalis]